MKRQLLAVFFVSFWESVIHLNAIFTKVVGPHHGLELVKLGSLHLDVDGVLERDAELRRHRLRDAADVAHVDRVDDVFDVVDLLDHDLSTKESFETKLLLTWTWLTV